LKRILMNKEISVLFAAVLLGAVTGCTQYKVDQQLVAEPDPVALRLSSAVDKATAALQTLASVEQARNPGVSLQMPPTAPVELRRIVSVDWTGPIEPIAKSMADRAGYQMHVNGQRPPTPIIISLVAREKSVVEVLRDIGLQAGQHADVVVDPEHRLVEVNYAPISGG
jgi:defect-in-organelle-trafficking protein DotD